MALRDRVKDKAAAFKGLRSGLPIESYGIDSAEQVQNFVLKDGQLKKVNGNETYAEVLGEYAGGVKYISRFKNLWIVQRGPAIAVETVEASKVFTKVTGLVTSENKMFSAPWRDRIFLTNAVETDFFLNRSSVLENYKYGRLGVDAPPYYPLYNSISETDQGTGNLANGQYQYTITFFDAETNSESPAFGASLSQDGLYDLSLNSALGPVLWDQITVAAGPSSVTIGGPTKLITYLGFVKPLIPRATHFSVYRTGAKVNGLYESFFRVPLKNGGAQDGNYIIDIDAFIAEGLDFKDNTAVLPAVSLPENNSPPPTVARAVAGNARAIADNITTEEIDAAQCSSFRHVKVFRDQLFGIGAKAPGYYIEEAIFEPDQQRVTGVINDFSSILYGSEVYQPDYFPYLWEVGRGDGQEAIGLGVLIDTALLVFKEKSAYYLAGSAPENFVLRIMDTNKGAIHESCIQDTPIGVITLDRGGFVLYDKIGLGKRISKEIQDIIDRIQFQYVSTFYSSYDPKENRYNCAIAVEGSATPNITLHLDLDTMEWTMSQGLEGLARHQDTNSDGEFVDLLGSATNGRLLDFAEETNVTDQGAPIEAIWKSGTINFGEDQRKKKMRWIYLRAKSNSSWKVDIEVIPDYDESRKYVIQNWDSVAALSTWYSSDVAVDGSLIWDDGTWASDGKARQVSKIPIRCSGYTFQIRIINREADAERYGFTIESISCEAALMGK